MNNNDQEPILDVKIFGKIKPCPFCVAEGRKIQFWSRFHMANGEIGYCMRYFVACKNLLNCGARGPERDLAKEAIGAWNNHENLQCYKNRY